MVLQVTPTPTRFPTSSLYTPMDKTPLHFISSVCHSCGGVLRLWELPTKGQDSAAHWYWERAAARERIMFTRRAGKVRRRA